MDAFWNIATKILPNFFRLQRSFEPTSLSYSTYKPHRKMKSSSKIFWTFSTQSHRAVARLGRPRVEVEANREVLQKPSSHCHQSKNPHPLLLNCMVSSTIP